MRKTVNVLSLVAKLDREIATLERDLKVISRDDLIDFARGEINGLQAARTILLRLAAGDRA